MSVEQDDWGWLRQWQRAVRDSKLDGTTKLVLYGLATFEYEYESGSRSFPSQEALAKGSRVGQSTVRRALREGEKAGFIEVIDGRPRVLARSDEAS